MKLFSGINHLFIFKEYPAREHKSKGYSAKELSAYLDNATYIKTYKQIKQLIAGQCFEDNSCVAFVGAGDINDVGARLAKAMMGENKQ